MKNLKIMPNAEKGSAYMYFFLGREIIAVIRFSKFIISKPLQLLSKQSMW